MSEAPGSPEEKPLRPYDDEYSIMRTSLPCASSRPRTASAGGAPATMRIRCEGPHRDNRRPWCRGCPQPSPAPPSLERRGHSAGLGGLGCVAYEGRPAVEHVDFVLECACVMSASAEQRWRRRRWRPGPPAPVVDSTDQRRGARPEIDESGDTRPLQPTHLLHLGHGFAGESGLVDNSRSLQQQTVTRHNVAAGSVLSHVTSWTQRGRAHSMRNHRDDISWDERGCTWPQNTSQHVEARSGRSVAQGLLDAHVLTVVHLPCLKA